MAAQHGTRTRYNTGCRCDACKQASRDYDKIRRQRMLASKHAPATVTKLPTLTNADEGEPGRVEAAVIAEIAGLSTAESRPSLVEAARSMAKVLDSPLNISQHAACVGKLQEVMKELRKGADSRAGKLAAVRQMTRKTGAAG